MNTAFLCGCVLYFVAACSAGDPGPATQTAFFNLLMEEGFLYPNTTVDALFKVVRRRNKPNEVMIEVDINRQNDDASYAKFIRTLDPERRILDKLEAQKIKKVLHVIVERSATQYNDSLKFYCDVEFVEEKE